MTESIKIKYHADIEPIEKITVGDWIDLRAAEDVKIGKGAFKLISLGVSMKLPDGYEAHIVPRSSTFKNWGIIQTNGMGIIDNSYSGTNDVWKFPAYCLAPTGCEWDKDNYYPDITHIHKGDRICQLVMTPITPCTICREITLNPKDVEKTERGSGGFGSTGK